MAQALILICADLIRNEIASPPARLLVWRRLWWPLFDWRDCDIALLCSVTRPAGRDRQSAPRAVLAWKHGANIRSYPWHPLIREQMRESSAHG